MNLLEVGLQAMRRNLSFEARTYQKKKKANSNSSSTSSSSSYNISIEDCSYDEPDLIKNKVRLYCLVVLIAYTTINYEKQYYLNYHWPHDDLQ